MDVNPPDDRRLLFRIGERCVLLEGEGVPHRDELSPSYRSFLYEDQVDWRLTVARGEEIRSFEGRPSPSINCRWEGEELIATHPSFAFRLHWADGSGDGTLRPFEGSTIGPMGFFLRLWLSLDAISHGGLPLHAASVAGEEGAYLFCAEDEGGKTTLSSMWNRGVILSDDYSLVGYGSGYAMAHPTPFRREIPGMASGSHDPVPLRGVYFLQKSPEHRLEPLSQREALVELMRRVFFFSEGGPLASLLLDSCCRLVESLPCHRLHFAPDPGVWRAVFGASGVTR